jgi:hypothetical protein
LAASTAFGPGKQGKGDQAAVLSSSSGSQIDVECTSLSASERLQLNVVLVITHIEIQGAKVSGFNRETSWLSGSKPTNGPSVPINVQVRRSNGNRMRG